MDYKQNIIFNNGKDLALLLKEGEFTKFLDEMGANKPHWNEDKKSGFGVPLFNVLYYTFTEYTAEMKKADEERIKQAQELVKQEGEKKNEV